MSARRGLRIAAALGRRTAAAARALGLRPRGFEAVLERVPQGSEVGDEHGGAHEADHQTRGFGPELDEHPEKRSDNGCARQGVHPPQQEGGGLGGRLVGEALPGEGPGSRTPGGDAVGDRVRILHVSNSMTASALAACVLILAALVCPPPSFPSWAMAASYPVGLPAAWAGTMWLGRRRRGPPPPPRSGEGRMALSALALVLILVPGDPETARLGFWAASAALMAGAWADGELLAVVSLRRNLGLLRTLTTVDRLHRAACREAWSEATGRTP